MPSLPSINLPSIKLPDFFCKPIPEEKACAKGNAVYTNDELKGMGTPFTWKFKVKFTGTRYCTTSLMHKAAEQRDRPAIKVPSGSYKLSVYCFKDYDQCVTTDSLSYQVWNDVCIIHDGTQCMVFVDNVMVRQARDPPPEANNGPMYMSDPWDDAAEAVIKDLTIEPGVKKPEPPEKKSSPLP
jgi:hypothetical protein